MANDKPSRKDDLAKARVIVGEYGLLIGPAGKLSETVAKAVADGIALGRKEAWRRPSRPPAAKAHAAVDPCNDVQ